MTPGDETPQPPQNPKRRQTSALVFGLVFGIGGLVFAVVHLLSGGSWPPALGALAISCFAYALLLRPYVQIAAEGARLENVVRSVIVPWPDVDLVEARWALEVVTHDGSGYTAWAVAAQRPQRETSGGLDMLGSLGRARLEHAVERTHSAGRLGQQILAAAQQYETGVASGELAAVEPGVRIRPAWPGVAAVAAGVAMVVAAFLL
ncbi:hypothetical protein ACMYYO_11750 [Dermacoccaceae bacterium W4C1]